MSQYLIDQMAAIRTSRCGSARRSPRCAARRTSPAPRCTGPDGPEELDLAALFVFIGQQPRTEWLEGTVARDSGGFVLTGAEPAGGREGGKNPTGWGLDREPFLLESSMPGVFVAGDVRHRSVKRIASAVGEGSMAVQFVHQYLATL